MGLTNPGIVTPIQAKRRPASAGIAYQGFKEKTEQSKIEARRLVKPASNLDFQHTNACKRRGDKVSDDEEVVPKIKRSRVAGAVAQDRSGSWKKEPKTKRKVQHLTYEEIMAAADDTSPTSAGIGVIIDATGATVSDFLREWDALGG